MIKRLKYLIISLSLIFFILIISFKIFDKLILEERAIILESIYHKLPNEFSKISDMNKKKIFLDITNYQKQQKYGTTFLKVLVYYISSYEYDEIPYLLYGKTMSVVLRNDNNFFKGHKQYALEKSYYSMALMKLDIVKVIALYSYYGAIDEKGKFVY